MKPWLVHLPIAVTVTLAAALAAHGPIAQFAHYHEFADQSVLMGVPHAADVLSNLAFAAVGAWGLLRVRSLRLGYLLFLGALLLTAFGSAFYHLAPDNARLVWDRLPIALACASLLAAVRAECVSALHEKRDVLLLAVFAVLGVGWWHFTAQSGDGDLRPYLLLQLLPLILIPLWQWVYRVPLRDRIAFACALALYAVAKVAELYDHQVMAALGAVSGHTIKHLLAAAASAIIVGRLVERRQAQPSTRVMA